MSTNSKLDLLGKSCRDIVTGYEGICVGTIEWMFGCDQYRLKARTADNVKAEPAHFYKAQLEVTGSGIIENVEIPEYNEPKFFGKECRDKVTGRAGICIGRMISLFNCDQYILEYESKGLLNDIQLMWLDEGRLEVLPEQKKEVKPEEVKSPRAGGVMPPEYYPQIPGKLTVAL